MLKLSLVLLVASGLFSGSLGLGGPINRRRGKDNELQIDLPEGAASVEIAAEPGASSEVADLREGRNLANVFPFVGGERGE